MVTYIHTNFVTIFEVVFIFYAVFIGAQGYLVCGHVRKLLHDTVRDQPHPPLEYLATALQVTLLLITSYFVL